jgi:hypothetical protein
LKNLLHTTLVAATLVAGADLAMAQDLDRASPTSRQSEAAVHGWESDIAHFNRRHFSNERHEARVKTPRTARRDRGAYTEDPHFS